MDCKRNIWNLNGDNVKVIIDDMYDVIFLMFRLELCGCY